MKKEWLLPNLFLYDNFTFALIDTIREFDIENPLKYIYGIVRCNWAYNYDSFLKFFDKEIFKETFVAYSNINITPILNFSKTDISKDDLQDDFCNYLLDLCYETNGKIMLSSDILFDYIKNKYPDMKLISSVNKPIYKFQNNSAYNIDEELNYYIASANIFDKVVIRPEFLKNFENKEIFENKDKYIILTNSACVDNCSLFDECNRMVGCQCPNKIFKKNGDFKKYFESIDNMLSEAQINDLFAKGYSYFMLKDNKQYLSFLYPLFIKCLFENYDNVDAVSEFLKSKIRQYNSDEKSMSQKIFGKNIVSFSWGINEYTKLLNL